MKKITVFTLVMVLALALTACGGRNDAPTETTPPATQAPTAAPTIPTIDPTMGTNIPDPEVDSTMPDLMDPTEDATGGTGGQDQNATSGNGETGTGTSGNMGQ